MVKTLFWRKSPLEKALVRGLKPDFELEIELATLGEVSVRTVREARQVRDTLSRLRVDPHLGMRDVGALLPLFESAETSVAIQTLADEAIPVLIEIVGIRRYAAEEVDSDFLLEAFRILALYQNREAMPILAAAARQPLAPDSEHWFRILECFDKSHPYREAMCGLLGDPDHSGSIGVAYLSFANELLADHDIDHHPFDSVIGHERIRGWLRGSLEEAQPAVAAIPAMDELVRSSLLETAITHGPRQLRPLLVKVAAKLGAVDALLKLSRDPWVATQALRALGEVGQDRVVGFEEAAVVSVCDELQEVGGEIAGDVSVVERRSGRWPLTDEEVDLVLVRHEDAVGSVDHWVAGGDRGPVRITSPSSSVAESWGAYLWQLSSSRHSPTPADLESCVADLRVSGFLEA